jgi:hypothetical protein
VEWGWLRGVDWFGVVWFEVALFGDIEFGACAKAAVPSTRPTAVVSKSLFIGVLSEIIKQNSTLLGVVSSDLAEKTVSANQCSKRSNCRSAEKPSC